MSTLASPHPYRPGGSVLLGAGFGQIPSLAGEGAHSQAATQPRVRYRPRRRRVRYSRAVLALAVATLVTSASFLSTTMTAWTDDTAATGVYAVRHALVALLVGVLALTHLAIIRSTGRPRWATSVVWLGITVPLAVHSALLLRDQAIADPAAMVQTWPLIAVHPGWVALVAVLAAGDPGRRISRRSAAALGFTVLGSAAVAWAGPSWTISATGSTRSWTIETQALAFLAGVESGPLRAGVVSMLVCAALVAGATARARRRWMLVLLCSLPVVALALLPTLVTGWLSTDLLSAEAPGAVLADDQRWSLVVLPLAAIAAAAPGALMSMLRR